MSVIIGAVMLGAVGAGLVWFGVGQFRHGVDRPWSHRVRGIAYATGGLGVLVSAIVFATGWSGGLVGVLPGLLIVAAFYVGGSAAWLARTVENWQAERARRYLEQFMADDSPCRWRFVVEELQRGRRPGRAFPRGALGCHRRREDDCGAVVH